MAKEINLNDLVRILVQLFPSQHKNSSNWLKKIPTEQTVETGSIKRHRIDFTKQPFNKVKHSKSTPPFQPVKEISKPVCPDFAHKINEDVAIWSSAIVMEYKLSMIEEDALVDKVKKLTGLESSELFEGCQAHTRTFSREWSRPNGDKTTITIFVPRIASPSNVLLGLQKNHGLINLYEMTMADIGLENINKIKEYFESF